MSYSTKALTLFGILPLVLKQFSSGDIVLWYLFSTIITLQSLADFGFRQTFSRVISYAYSGAKQIGVINSRNGTSIIDGPNLPLLTTIISTMKYIYVRLTWIIFVLMAILGTWSMYKPVQSASSMNGAWLAWLVVLVVSCVGFYGKLYMNFLEGLYKIALVRRIETLTSLGSIITSIIVLLYAPTLLNLVVANQFWVLAVTYRDWYLCRKVENGLYQTINLKTDFDKETFNSIWQPAWRSGISGFMSIGLTNLTGIIYAQVGNTEAVASYLLALRVITQIRDIAMAPFYSKIPLLAMLRAKNDVVSLKKTIKKGMLLSHWVFVIGYLAVGLLSHPLLVMMKSNVQFVSQQMWVLLGFAFFIHRFGAMHMQVYLSTNHVISHIADGISGVIYIVSSVLLIKFIGVYAIPVGMLAGYLGFYSWYAAKHSYSSIGVSLWSFEKNVSILPILISSLYIVLTLFKIGL